MAPRGKLLLALCLFQAAFAQATQAQNLLYATDFTSDPEWISDQPENFYWDPLNEAFYSMMENAVPDPYYAPNRYAYTRTRLDSAKPFHLTWDQLNLDLDSYGHNSFGLYSADLISDNRTYIYLPQLISESTVNVDFSGYGTSGDGFGLNVIDSSGYDHGFGTYGGGRDYSGVWYTIGLSYDAAIQTLSYSVTERDSGSEIFSGARQGVQFSRSMVNLGMSQFPIGEHPQQIYAARPNDVATALIDNIFLYGAFLPPPHYTQGSGSEWAAAPLLGSPKTGDTMAKYGCFVSATAMLLNHYGHDTDPGSLNAFLSDTIPGDSPFLSFADIPQSRFYGQGDGIAGSPVRFLSGSFATTATRDQIASTIQTAIDDYGPVVLRVPQYSFGLDGYPATAQHAILAWSVDGTDILIRDPGSLRTGLPLSQDIESLTLDDYINYINSSVGPDLQLDADYGFLQGQRFTYAEIIGDDALSVLRGSARSPVDFLLIDPLGRRVGYDPVIGEFVLEIPGSSYGRIGGIASPDGDLLLPEDGIGVVDFQIGELVPGDYQLDVFGIDAGGWEIGFGISSPQGFDPAEYVFSGVASAGSMESFGFTVVPEPSSSLLLLFGLVIVGVRRRAVNGRAG